MPDKIVLIVFIVTLKKLILSSSLNSYLSLMSSSSLISLSENSLSNEGFMNDGVIIKMFRFYFHTFNVFRKSVPTFLYLLKLHFLFLRRIIVDDISLQLNFLHSSDEFLLLLLI